VTYLGIVSIFRYSLYSIFFTFFGTLHFGLVFVFDDFLLKGYVLDSALPFYHFFASIHSCAHHLGICGSNVSSCRNCWSGVVASTDCILFADSRWSSAIDIVGWCGGEIVGSGGEVSCIGWIDGSGIGIVGKSDGLSSFSIDELAVGSLYVYI